MKRPNGVETGDAKSLSSSLGSLTLLSTVFFFNIASRLLLAPLMPEVEADLGIGHGQAGSLFLLMSVGYCAALLGSGFVNSRLTHKATIALSSVLLGAVLLAVGSVGTLDSLRVGLTLIGFAAGLYLSSGVATITSLVQPTDWGKALSLHELAPNLGFAVAPVAAEALLRLTSWRGVLAAFGVAEIAIGVLYALLAKGGRFRSAPPSWQAAGVLVSSRSFWILLVLFALGVAVSFGVYSMLPLYLTLSLGLERGYANGLVAVSRLSGLATVFASGWISDRLGPRRALVVILALSAVLTVPLGVVPRGWIAPIVFLQPMAGAWFFPAAFAALSALGPLGVALAVPFAMTLGAGFAPLLIGALGDRGAFGVGLVVVGLLAGAGSVLAAKLRLPAPTDKRG